MLMANCISRLILMSDKISEKCFLFLLKGNIRVFCRVRPLLGEECLGNDGIISHIGFLEDTKTLELEKLADQSVNEVQEDNIAKSHAKLLWRSRHSNLTWDFAGFYLIFRMYFAKWRKNLKTGKHGKMLTLLMNFCNDFLVAYTYNFR